MRQCLAKLAMLVSSGGCSIIYNPDHIHGDAKMVDVEITTDVNPQLLELDNAFPTTVDEGAGQFGNKGQLIVLQGKQIADDAQVSVTSTLGAVMATSVTLARDHNFIAIVLAAPIDSTHDQGAMGDIKITVTQLGGSVTKTYPDDAMMPSPIKLVFHDQLTAMSNFTSGQLYSQIAISGGVAFAKATGHRAVFRSVSNISFGGALNADGGTPEAGPGGCRGGGVNADGAAMSADSVACTGHGSAPGGVLGHGGGGAGYVSDGETPANGGAGGPMMGDPQISSLATNVASGGGGGSQLSVAGGASGGGGGGTLQFDAGGDIALGAISAVGGGGGNGNTGGGGGGGAGGTVLIRGYGTVTVLSLTLIGGTGGPGGTGDPGGGGAGRDGRARVDAAHGMLPGAYPGPMFVDVQPTSPTMTTTMVNLVGKMLNSDAVGHVFDKKGNVVAQDHGDTFTPNFGTTSTAQPLITLTAGYNKVCVSVAGGSIDPLSEATNCVEMAFLP